MELILSGLINLQEVDLVLDRIEKNLTEIPVRKENTIKSGIHIEEKIKSEKSTLQTKQSQLKKMEVECISLEEKIQKLKVQQMQVKTNEEYRAINIEIDGLEAKIRETEDKELQIMEEIEEIKLHIERLNQELIAVKARITEDIEMLDRMTQELMEEKKKYSIKKEELIKNIPEKQLIEYKRIRSRYSNAVVPVAISEESKVCTGCHIALPPYVINELKRNSDLVFCNFCGRILYIEDQDRRGME